MHHCTTFTSVSQLHISLGFFGRLYIPERWDKTRKYLGALKNAGVKEQGHCKRNSVYHNGSVCLSSTVYVCCNTPFFSQSSSSSCICHYVHCGDAGCWNEREGLCCVAHLHGSPLVGIFARHLVKCVTSLMCLLKPTSVPQ